MPKEWGQALDDSLDVFLNSTIKQIVMYLDWQEYNSVITRLSAIRKARPELKNNTLMFLEALSFYETHYRKP